MKNRMQDLRNHLFETLEGLKDEEKPMDVARALAVSKVADTLIASAKVEIEFMRATDAVIDGRFFDSPIDEPRLDKRDQRRLV